MKDLDRLLEIHGDLGGDARGRRFRLEVLNKSAIVLIASCWEEYCEDIAAEVVDAIVKLAPSSAKLSKHIEKVIAMELKGDANDIGVWSLADDGWKKVLRARLAQLQDERNRRLHTPKSAQINQPCEQLAGWARVSTRWALQA